MGGAGGDEAARSADHVRASAGEASAADDGARARALGLAALLLGACAIGAAPVFVRLAEAEGVGPTAAGFWRAALAIPLLAAWSAATPKPASGQGRRAFGFAVLAGLFFAGDLGFWHAGVVRTTIANATFLPNLSPVVVTLVAWALFRERITAGFMAGLGLAVLGAALLTGANLAAAPERLAGDALSAATAVWYAGYFLAMKSARRGFSAVRAMAVSTIVTAPPLLAAALAFGEPIIPHSALGWVWLAGLGVFAHVLGQGGIAFGLGRLPAALSSVVVLVQPVVAAVLGQLALNEPPLVAAQYAGGAAVLTGVVVAQRLGSGRARGAGQ